MGKMLPIKGFELSLHAFAHCVKTIPDAKFIIVGKGPEKPSIEKLIEELGIGKNIEMINWAPRKDALAIMKKADVFLYPSFEGSGMVTLEAMANGLPVVCLDFGGAGEMVNSASGIKVRPENFNETTKNLGGTLVKLYNEVELRKSMGSSAIRRIKNRYLWENRYKNINEWYDIATTNHTNII
jgi:glycosyltransferase involved in cell wall biosynthesis